MATDLADLVNELNQSNRTLRVANRGLARRAQEAEDQANRMAERVRRAYEELRYHGYTPGASEDLAATIRRALNEAKQSVDRKARK